MKLVDTNIVVNLLIEGPYSNSAAAAEATLTEAQHLLSQGLRSVADNDVLSAAAHFGVSGYDARFLVVARAIGQPLITEDAKLRRAAPGLTCSIAEALAD